MSQPAVDPSRTSPHDFPAVLESESVSPRWYVRGLWVCFACDLAKHALLMLAGSMQPWPDSHGYWQLGQDAMHGDWWLVGSGNAHRTPVYPWFLAVLQSVSGRYALFNVVLCQHLLELVASWLTASAVWQITGSRRASLAAYCVCALLTARSLFANTILTESLAVFLLAWLVWLITRPAFAQSWRLVSAAAIVLGIAILERPAAIAFLPAVTCAAAMIRSDTNRISWRQRCQRIGVVLGVTALILLPWCLRNAIVWQRFTISAFAGRELWTANFSPWPGAHLVVPETGAGRELRERLRGEPVDWRHNWSVSSALGRTGLNDVEQDELMKDVALQAIRENPWSAAMHTGARCLTFWYVKDWDLSDVEDPVQGIWHDQASWSKADLRNLLRRWLRWTPEQSFPVMWFWSAATWLGVLVLMLHPPSRPIGITFCGLLLGLTVLTAVLEIPLYRYRCIVEPVMVIAAVSGMTRLRSCPVVASGSESRSS